MRDNELTRFLAANLSRDELTRDVILQEMRVSRTRFYELLSATGKDSLPVLINELRMDKARELLKSTELTVGEVAYQVGFAEPSYFTRIFRKHSGVTPLEFRALNKKR
jgi:AraC-like DNA-binding protein